MRIVIIFLAVIFTSLPVAYPAFFKGSVYVGADDHDLPNLNLDKSLENIVKQVVRIWDGEDGHGSALLTGSDCGTILTAKHNFFDPKSGERYVRNQEIDYEYNDMIHAVSLPVNKIPKWRVANEALVLKTKYKSPLKTCNKIKFVKREQLRPNKNCVIIGFPSDPANGGYSPVLDINEEAYGTDKKAIAKCSITKINYDGKVINNCSSGPGGSGGPIACKYADGWRVAAINDGDICGSSKGDRLSEDFCINSRKPVEYNQFINSEKKYRAYARAGSLTNFMIKELSN